MHTHGHTDTHMTYTQTHTYTDTHVATCTYVYVPSLKCELYVIYSQRIGPQPPKDWCPVPLYACGKVYHCMHHSTTALGPWYNIKKCVCVGGGALLQPCLCSLPQPCIYALSSPALYLCPCSLCPLLQPVSMPSSPALCLCSLPQPCLCTLLQPCVYALFPSLVSMLSSPSLCLCSLPQPCVYALFPSLVSMPLFSMPSSPACVNALFPSLVFMPSSPALCLCPLPQPFSSCSFSPSPTLKTLLFENCSCVAEQLREEFGGSHLYNSSATTGVYDNDSCNGLYIFLVFIGVTLFLVFVLQVPIITITVRCVAF